MGINFIIVFTINICIMSENFCLKWNDFHSNISKSFTQLRHEDDFFDVTLVSDDQDQISAHKVVLSASSEYFKNILRKYKHPNPLLCLEGINSNELKNILDYLYNGEVKIFQEDLNRFLNVAERFKLEGLMSNEGGSVSDDSNAIKSNLDNKSKMIFNDVKEFTPDEVPNDDSEENNTVVAQTKAKILITSEGFSNVDELDAKILEHIEKDGSRWKCNICDKILRFKTHAKEHVEIHFDGLTFQCSECDAILRSRNSLRIHRKKHSSYKSNPKSFKS